MTYGVIHALPRPSPELSGRAAIVGIGETDYDADYAAARARAPGHEPPTVESLCEIAFARALADSGLDRAEIDGLSLSFTFGGPEPADLARQLGLTVPYCIANGNIMAGPLPVVCADIAAGKADTVAMIFAVASRSIGRQFGGLTDRQSADSPPSYYYHHPWGFSSQAAHWALMLAAYQAAHGTREEDLGALAIQVREHARATPGAIMRQPLTMDAYLAARMVVRPLRLLDLCLVNDGAVCLIVRRADLAGAMAHAPVLVAGWGEARVKHDKMHAMVRERLAGQMREAGGQALAMAGASLADVGHFEGYDAATIHLVNQVEGYGFTPPGTGLAFCRDGQMTLGGRLPTNLSGGNLSGSYMQGWSQVAEAVRQLRHEAGPRQVRDLRLSLTSLVQTDRAHPLVLRRGE
ncbi:thiolase family protein [Novosphingobium bradum]|uniref:Thiolase family protein n=1 Tax=Novosphingobium bradum TaxID=1737444 RepID=A0ABV7IP98_9SPHN